MYVLRRLINQSLWLSIIMALEWTTGLTFKSMAYNKIPLLVKLHSPFKSISHSIIYLTAQNHTPLKQGKIVDEGDVIFITTREGSLHVSNLCEDSSMNSSTPKHLGRRKVVSTRL